MPAVDVEDTAFPAGPIALAYNAGIIRDRKPMIRPPWRSKGQPAISPAPLRTP